MALTIDRALVQKRFFEFMDRVIFDELDSLINEMIRRSPKLLCRLNFKNSKVAELVRNKINAGLVNPFDLMFDPEETFNRQSQVIPLTAEDQAWLEHLERKWLRLSQESGIGLVLA